MFGKHKKQEIKTVNTEASAEKSVLSYFIPFAVLMALLVSCLLLIGNWWSKQDMQDARLESTKVTATAVKQQLQAVIDGKRELLQSVARQEQLIAILASKDGQKISIIEQQLLKEFPQALDVQLIPFRKGKEALLNDTPGSYVLQDMHQKTMQSGVMQNAEALRGADGKSQFLIVVPVGMQPQLSGSLLVRYPMNLLGNGIVSLSMPGAALSVEQVVAGTVFQLAVSDNFNAAGTLAHLPVPHTNWQISYGLIPVMDTDTLLLFAIGLLVALILVGLLYSVIQMLSTAIKSDMGLAVSLMDTTLKRTGTPTCHPKIKECEPAITLLTKYAQATYMAGKAETLSENHAGMPKRVAADDIVVEDMYPSSAPPVLFTEEKLPLYVFSDCGIVAEMGEIMSPSFAQEVGRAIGTKALAADDRAIFVGQDVRLNSAEYANALIAGILSSGCDVVDLGIEPHGVISFAVNTLEHQSSVMVTGSNTPANFMGFQITLGGQIMAGEQLQSIRDLMLSGDYSIGSGNLETKNVSADYVRHVTTDIQLTEPKKIVIDAGNGAAGPLAVRLFENLGCEVIALFCEPDGNFPNHFPVPSDPENISSLILEVQAQGADLGIAIDGDGSSITMIDEQGRKVPSDQLLMFLATDIIRRHPGADIIYDLEATNHMAGFILSNGGRPIMAQGDICAMVERMAQTGALLSGTSSGHYIIKDRWYGTNDGLYATARLLELLSIDELATSEFFADFPTAAAAEKYSLLAATEQLDVLLQVIQDNADFTGADVTELGGLRAEFVDSWVSIRVDHPHSSLFFKFEAKDVAALNQVKDKVRAAVQTALPDAKVPF